VLAAIGRLRMQPFMIISFSVWLDADRASQMASSVDAVEAEARLGDCGH
jgi:hypothetical protein